MGVHGVHEVTSDVGFALARCLLTAPHLWAGRRARATESMTPSPWSTNYALMMAKIFNLLNDPVDSDHKSCRDRGLV